MAFDGEKFGKEMVEAVKAYVDRKIAENNAGQRSKPNDYMSLQAAFDAGFEAVKGYVDRSFEDIEKRISDLEKMEKGAKPRVRVSAGSERG